MSCDQPPSNGTTADLVQVSGRVTVDSRPLARAAVLFLPIESGSRARGFTSTDGEFTLLDESESAGIAPGEYRVVFQGLKVPGGKPSLELDADYQSLESTPVLVTITEATSILNFQLPKRASDYKNEA